ncbi:MAG TPA: L-2-amino-thiazoline-4-carboxylic acid hydrolase [Syntrophomonadaceae bacterium]|jgi:hypothetical protein|nr:L-2-amino-thiazoline-4-carboxylic acid hydrolase [Syntrophomonadaceae bacterium]HRX20685.1 L-2-amino-thiazoline-4-carboxylic acid hydrolase [Syntrophomonadaceae bacterium]
MKKNSTFAKTILPNLFESLAAVYGNETGIKIFNAAKSILAGELAEVNDRGNKIIGRHLRRNILPGYACYRAMLDAGISSSEAVEFVRDELCRSVEPRARFYKKLGSKSYIFGIIRILARPVLKYGFPRQGWTIVMLENNKERVRFDMTSCLYLEELHKRGASELCPAFCFTDEVIYKPLAPAVVFKRKDTLAQKGTRCDYCFEKGIGKKRG